MIIVSICGGLGNQLQQYAVYRKFISLGRNAKVDLSWFDADVQAEVATKRRLMLDRFYGIEYDVCTKEEKRRLVELNRVERILSRLGLDITRVYYEYDIYDPKLLNYKDKYIEGAFTCDYYYSDILSKLRREIVFPVDKYCNKDKLTEVAQDIEQHYSVSIHLRRGDYLDDINRHIYENICTDAYYLQALEYCLKCAKSVKSAKIYGFSDDPQYADKYLSHLVKKRSELLPYEVVDFNCNSDSLFDIYLMSLCDCNITANSTFSYWGARLNSKENAIRIRPARHKNPQNLVSEDMIKLCPGWILVSPKGYLYGI